MKVRGGGQSDGIHLYRVRRYMPAARPRTRVHIYTVAIYLQLGHKI